MGYYTTSPNTKIYFANGMDNTLKDAKKSAANLEEIVKQPVGIILNDTHGLFGDNKGVGDIPEYLNNRYTKKDILNEYTYRKINNEAKGKVLIITHSAGNEDINKALSLGYKEGYTYPNLNIISVGSPLSKSKLKNTLTSVKANLIGQVNDWKDPVTHSKTVGAGVIGLGLIGAYFSPEISIPALGLAGKTAIGQFAAGAAGVAAGAGVGAAGVIGGVNLFHPFKTYLKKPKLKNMIKQSVFNTESNK